MKWLSNLFKKEVEITIWGADLKETFVLKKVTSVTSNQIKGLDTNNKYFEYTSIEPFNYKIQKK